MALSPFHHALKEKETTKKQPSKTYKLDLEKGEVGGYIDGDEAIEQFIEKAVLTARFRFLIYNDQYGSELYDLIGKDVSFDLLKSEVPRVVTESLIYDDRIKDVQNFEIRREKDRLYLSFDVITEEETVINQEVSV